MTCKHKTSNGFNSRCGSTTYGSPEPYQSGNVDHISGVIFYVILHSLDKMLLILEQSYKDFPAVSNELVKCLSMNTSIDVVDRLVS